MPFLAALNPKKPAVLQRAKAVCRTKSVLSFTAQSKSRLPVPTSKWKNTNGRNPLGLPIVFVDSVQKRDNWVWLQWFRISESAVKSGAFNESDMDSMWLLKKVLAPELYQEVIELYDKIGEDYARSVHPHVILIGNAFYVFFDIPRMVRVQVDAFASTLQYRFRTPLKAMNNEGNVAQPSCNLNTIATSDILPPTPAATPGPRDMENRVKRESDATGSSFTFDLENHSDVPGELPALKIKPAESQRGVRKKSYGK